MKRKTNLGMLFSLLIAATACLQGVRFQKPFSKVELEMGNGSSSPTAREIPLSTPSLTPFSPSQTIPPSSPQPTPEETALPYSPAFGIEYQHPDRYLRQGEQSRISDPALLDPLRSDQHHLDHLEMIYRWLHTDFEAYSAGGKTIGVVTVDDLLREHRLGGCHDFALLFAAAARELGYPAVMNRTDSISWVARFQEGQPDPHVGHVFVEVFLDGSWILVDPTNGWVVEEGYDPAQPVIPLKEHITGPSAESMGFYVERKGLDVWDFGIYSQEESTRAMDALAETLDLAEIRYPDYQFTRWER